MKSFYFVNGERSSRESYTSILNKINNDKHLESQLKNEEKRFQHMMFINGQTVKYDSQDEKKEIELPIPEVYSDKEQVIIEVPNFYECYCINFLKNKEGNLSLLIQTPNNDNAYSIENFENYPTELKRKNGILIFT